MLTEPTTNQAADKAGVSARSIRNWLKDPDFIAALAEAETQAISQAARKMAGGAGRAVDALLKVLDDDLATTSERIQAAKGIIGYLPNLRLLGSIEARLEQLTNELDT